MEESIPSSNRGWEMSALEQKHEKILGGIVIRVSSCDRNTEMCQADRSYLLGRLLALEEILTGLKDSLNPRENK